MREDWIFLLLRVICLPPFKGSYLNAPLLLADTGFDTDFLP